MAATKEKELSIEERLHQLWNLQQIDTKIDKIKILKGELPEEVQILEDVITGLNVRLSNLNEELTEPGEPTSTGEEQRGFPRPIILLQQELGSILERKKKKKKKFCQGIAS